MLSILMVRIIKPSITNKRAVFTKIKVKFPSSNTVSGANFSKPPIELVKATKIKRELASQTHRGRAHYVLLRNLDFGSISAPLPYVAR